MNGNNIHQNNIYTSIDQFEEAANHCKNSASIGNGIETVINLLNKSNGKYNLNELAYNDICYSIGNEIGKKLVLDNKVSSVQTQAFLSKEINNNNNIKINCI